MTNNELTKNTISHYENSSERFWQGTKDHDVTQKYNAFLEAIGTEEPFNILDLGCGPGRDLKYFKSKGHIAVGIDGSHSFCNMAREYSGCEVFAQDFIDLKLKDFYFDGIFANASMFHVPRSQLLDVITKLQTSLKKDGVFFSSNPRGEGESMDGLRYGNYMQLNEYKKLIESCGFKLINHYYRPDTIPVNERPWLACVFRKK